MGCKKEGEGCQLYGKYDCCRDCPIEPCREACWMRDGDYCYYRGDVHEQQTDQKD